MTVRLLCLWIAALCFAVATLWQPAPPRFNLVSAGLTFFVLAFIFP